MKHTPLYEYHLKNARMTEFAGFEMPLWYTKPSEEHLVVRNNAGVFDVSHMGRISVKGSDSDKFLEYVLPTKISTQPTGKSFYSIFLNEHAGIIDDLIVIKHGEMEYLLVVNAINTEKDLNHLKKQGKGFQVQLEDITSSSAMVAIQGPNAFRILEPLSNTRLDKVTRFTSTFGHISGMKATISRTGYTGEDGFEIILYDTEYDDSDKVLHIWKELLSRAKPCGLAARDSLRIEAGLPLYGPDMDENTNPVEADIRWVVSKEEKTEYIGSKKLSELANSEPSRIRRGMLLETRIPRTGHEVLDITGEKIGGVTSGTFSPLLKRGIALGYVRFEYAQIGRQVKVVSANARPEVGVQAIANIVKPPFYDQNLYGWKRAKRK